MSDNVVLRITVTRKRATQLQGYAKAHHVSLAEALTRAFYLLLDDPPPTPQTRLDNFYDTLLDTLGKGKGKL